ncbi:hypothetical protein AB0K09_32730 [Streptomyces sp. NPDC049577]|uniref:hypothetical protein n=1 Tax=Streptomyces sp. NPDC049577 TaxID=3155153 RepID=UPI00341A885D
MRRSVALVGAVVLLCAACSAHAEKKPQQSAKEGATPSGASADQSAAVRAAVATTVKSTARIQEQIKVDGGDGQSFTISVKGGFDMAGDKGGLTAGLSTAGSTAGSTADSAARLDEVFADGTVYIRMPQETTGDTAWRSIRRDEAVSHYVLRAPVNDPEHVLNQVSRMRAAVKAGEETVNGAPTVRYHGKLDTETLLLRMAEDKRAKFNEMLPLLGGEIPAFADVWVDRHGRIVRTRLLCNMAGTGVTATMDLTDHGKPVDTPSVPHGADRLPATAVGGPLGG